MVLTMARRPMVATRDHTFLHTRKPKPKCARSLTLAGAPGHPRRPVQPIPCLRSLGRDRPGQPCEPSRRLSGRRLHGLEGEASVFIPKFTPKPDPILRAGWRRLVPAKGITS